MLTVKERGQFVATLRYVHVFLMETLAAWVPTSPEMEAKLLFGEHIWDVAQHADALGKRTFELRLALQRSMRPSDGYVDLLSEIAALGPTPNRLAAIYDVILPAIVGRERAYLERTDKLVDAPTVRIFERHFADVTRMLGTVEELRRELPALQLADRQWTANLQAREAKLELVGDPAPEAVAVSA
jgi:hypothetical protein